MEGLETAEVNGFKDGLDGGMEDLDGGTDGLETECRPMVLKRRAVRELCVSTKDPKLSRGTAPSACRRATVA